MRVAIALCGALIVMSCGVGRAETAPVSITPAAQASPSSGALWWTSRGGKETDEAWAVDVGGDGSVYLATHEASPILLDIYVYKLTAEGREIWKARWGRAFGEQAFVLSVVNDVVYVGGFTQKSLGVESADMVVLALAANDGRLIWERTWDQGYGYEEVDGLVVDGSDIYVAGWTTGEKTGKDVALLKLDLSGRIVWSMTWGSAGWDEANGQIAVDADRVYVAGRYGASNVLIGGQAFIASFSKRDGTPIADARWGGFGVEDALGLIGSKDALYVTGITANHGNASQVFLRRYDRDLRLVWERLWGGAKDESARAAAVDPSGDIFIAAKTDSEGRGAHDLALLRFAPSGDLRSASVWGGTKDDIPHGLALSGRYVYLAAESESVGAGKLDALLVKVTTDGVFPPPP